MVKIGAELPKLSQQKTGYPFFWTTLYVVLSTFRFLRYCVVRLLRIGCFAVATIRVQNRQTSIRFRHSLGDTHADSGFPFIWNFVSLFRSFACTM